MKTDPTSPQSEAPAGLSEDQVKEFQGILGEVKGGWNQIKDLPATFRSLQDETGRLQQQFNQVRRLLTERGHGACPARRPGSVTDDCAKHLAAHFIAHCEKSDKLDALSSLPAQRDRLRDFARNTLNLTTRTALGTEDV